jgi:hypothetical protein
MRFLWIVSLVLVSVFPCSAFAQTSLPVKDFSVGNTFTYLYNAVTVEESIIKDTIINSMRYGVMNVRFFPATSVQLYYMRSNDTAVYQYVPAVGREVMSYRFGQPCLTSLLPWATATTSCTVNVLKSDSTALYTQPSIANNPAGLSYTGDMNYISRNVYFAKSYGMLLDSATSCYITAYTIQCRLSNPDCIPNQLVKYKQCSPSSKIALLRSIIKGVERSVVSPAPFKLELTTTGLTFYPDLFKLRFTCVHNFTYLAAANYGIPYVRCSIPIDTSLVEIVNVQTMNGARPDSISFSGKNVVLHCTFSTKSNGSDYITLKPKPFMKDTNIKFTIENPIFPPLPPAFAVFFVSPSRQSIQRSEIDFYIDGLDDKQSVRSDSVMYGQENSLNFGPFWVTPLTRSVLPDSLSFNLSLDTTGLANIRLLTLDSTKRIVPDSVRTQGKIKSYFCTVPTPPSYQRCGILCFRSISVLPTQNTVSIIGIKNPPGFYFAQRYYFPNIFRQLGIARSLQSDLAARVEAGNNIVLFTGPNPTANNITIRYIIMTPTDGIAIQLMSILGAVVFSAKLPGQSVGSYDFPIDLSSLYNGMYFLKISFNNNTETHRVMVSR